MDLTPRQQQQLAGFANNWNTQMQQLRQQAASNPALANQQFAQMQQAAQQQMDRVFTPQQAQTWSQVAGQNYNFPPGAYFGPSGPSAQNPGAVLKNGSPQGSNPAGRSAGNPGAGVRGTNPGAGAGGAPGAGGGTGAGGGGAGGGSGR